MSGLIAHPGQIWLTVDPVDMRRGIDALSMIVQQGLGHPPCAGSYFYILQPCGESHQGFTVGRHGGVVMSASFTSGEVCLAEAGRSMCRVNLVAAGMADCRGGLATVIGFATAVSSGIKISNND